MLINLGYKYQIQEDEYSNSKKESNELGLVGNTDEHLVGMISSSPVTVSHKNNNNPSFAPPKVFTQQERSVTTPQSSYLQASFICRSQHSQLPPSSPQPTSRTILQSPVVFSKAMQQMDEIVPVSHPFTQSHPSPFPQWKPTPQQKKRDNTIFSTEEYENIQVNSLEEA